MIEPAERLIRAMTKGWPEWMPKHKRTPSVREALPAIVYALYYLDFGWDAAPTFERCLYIWEHGVKPALEAEHFGDCTKQPQACIRCQAEYTMELARKIEEGLGL